MPALAEFNTALHILQMKGYRVWLDERNYFWAEKDGWDFVGDSPCGLLGVVAIYEHKRPSDFHYNWWKDTGDVDFNKLPRKAPDYIPVANHNS
jgi:hypothetical protein